MDQKIFKKSEIFKIVSDPTRLKILIILFEAKKELCVNEISELVGLSQSAISHQLAKLEDKNLVECFRMGQMMCYQIKQNNLSNLIKRIINEVSVF